MVQPIKPDWKNSSLVKKRIIYDRCYKQLTKKAAFSSVNKKTSRGTSNILNGTSDFYQESSPGQVAITNLVIRVFFLF